MTDRELLNIARDAMKHSYSPYSRRPTGAALECVDGTVFTGCNIENASFGATLCAETVALVAAVAAGKREFKRIAVASDATTYEIPCGLCRQMLNEFSPEVEVLAARSDNRYVSYKLSALFPTPYAK